MSLNAELQGDRTIQHRKGGEGGVCAGSGGGGGGEILHIGTLCILTRSILCRYSAWLQVDDLVIANFGISYFIIR